MFSHVQSAALVVLCAAVGVHPSPVISDVSTGETSDRQLLWASHPVYSNETVLLWGSGFTGVDSVTITMASAAHTTGIHNEDSSSPRKDQVSIQGDTFTAKTFDVTDFSCKVILPANLPVGVYKLCIAVNGNTTATCILLNAPDVFWKRGDVNLTVMVVDSSGSFIFICDEAYIFVCTVQSMVLRKSKLHILMSECIVYAFKFSCTL